MNKKTLSLILAISTTYLSGLAFAEEPFIGVGIVNHTYKQDPSGSANDVTAKPSSIKLTLGSRIAQNWIIEAYYLLPNKEDEIAIGGAGTKMDVEYETLIGASLNYAIIHTSSLVIYGGPNVTAAKIKAKSGNATLDAANDFDVRVSPGLGIGIDLTIYKKASLYLEAQSYLLDGDRTGFGTGAGLRYHL